MNLREVTTYHAIKNKRHINIAAKSQLNRASTMNMVKDIPF